MLALINCVLKYDMKLMCIGKFLNRFLTYKVLFYCVLCTNYLLILLEKIANMICILSQVSGS